LRSRLRTGWCEFSALYADNPGILFKLVNDKLAKAELNYLEQGWKEVVLCEGRPDNFYSLNLMEPEGRQEPNNEQIKKLETNRTAQEAILDDPESDPHFNQDLRELEREENQIEAALAYYTDEQRENGKAIIYLGYDGALEAHAVDLRRTKSGNVTELPKPDYSAKLVGELTKIKTLAVREAVAENPALALDLLVYTLLEKLVFDGDSSDLPLSIKPDARAVDVDQELMVQSEIRSVRDMSADDIGALSDEITLSDIISMNSDIKQQLLAYLVASQIDASGCYGADGVRRMDEVAEAAQIDLTAKWEPSVAFFERVSKPTLLKILREQCGEAVADNCASMKKVDLALAMADRLAGKDWLPPALEIASCNGVNDLEEAA